MWNNKAAQEQINEDRNSWCEKADKNFDSLKNKLGKVDKEITSIKSYNEVMSQQLQKTANRIESAKSEAHEQLQQAKEEYREKINTLDGVYSEKLEEMATLIDEVKRMAKDAVNQKEKELQAQMSKELREIKAFVDENIDDMVNERRATLAKYEK